MLQRLRRFHRAPLPRAIRPHLTDSILHFFHPTGFKQILHTEISPLPNSARLSGTCPLLRQIAALFTSAGTPYADFACGIFDSVVHFSNATPAFTAAARSPLSSVAIDKPSRVASST